MYLAGPILYIAFQPILPFNEISTDPYMQNQRQINDTWSKESDKNNLGSYKVSSVQRALSVEKYTRNQKLALMEMRPSGNVYRGTAMGRFHCMASNRKLISTSDC